MSVNVWGNKDGEMFALPMERAIPEFPDTQEYTLQWDIVKQLLVYVPNAAGNPAQGTYIPGFAYGAGSIGDYLNNLPSSNVGFLQSGTGAVLQSLQTKNRQIIDLTDFGPVDTTGVVPATAVFNLATAEAAAKGKYLRLPAGTILLDTVILPTTLPGLIGVSKYATTLKFIRQAYTAGQILINANNNTKGLVLADFGIDCDDPVFKTAGVYVVSLNGSNNVGLSALRVVGRGQSAVFTSSMSGGRIYDLTVDATGAAGLSFSTCFEGQGCFNVLVQNMKTTGLPQYSGVFGNNTYFSQFDQCHTEGTSGAFGYSMGGCFYSHITGCTARNTSHEAYQLTDSLYCSVTGNTCQWDAGFGVDAGISVHGKTLQTRLNKVIDNTIINSYGPGLLCADNAQLNIFDSNLLKDCGLRQYAATADPSASIMGQYTALPGVQCSGNTFSRNKIATEAANILNGYTEANNGVGSSITNTKMIDNEWQGGGVITTRYVFNNTSSMAWDLDFETSTPTITPGGGAITAYTATMVYRRRGKMIEIAKLFVNITASTGTGNLTLLWGGAPTAANDAGAVSGTDTGTGKMLGGKCNAGGVVLRYADGGSPAGAGVSFLLVGDYLLP